MAAQLMADALRVAEVDVATAVTLVYESQQLASVVREASRREMW